MSDATLHPDELARWTPSRRREFRKRMPASWPDIERRLIRTEVVLGLRPDPDAPPDPAVIEWNAIRPARVTPLARPRIEVVHIIALCANAGNLCVAELTGPRRVKSTVIYRHTAMYLATRHCKHLGLPTIGRQFGGRDHSTVIHARDRVEDDLSHGGEVFGDLVKRIEWQLGIRE